MHKSNYLLFNFLFFWTISFAQQKEEYNAVVYSQENGLASYNTQSIQQDKYGFIWIGTQDGISFYDGTSFRSITNRANTAAVDVKKIKYDSTRNLMWVAYSFGGFQAFDCQTHQPVFAISSLNSKALSKSPNIKTFDFLSPNKLLIGLTHEFFIYNVDLKKEEEIISIPGSYTTENEIKQIAIKDNNAYVFIEKTGICKLPIGQKEKISWILKDSLVQFKSCATNEKNIIWYSTLKGLYHLVTNTNEIISDKENFEINFVNILNDDSLLLSTPDGCFGYHILTHRLTKMKFNTGKTNSNYNLCSFIDNQRHLWLGFSELLLFSDFVKPTFSGLPKEEKSGPALTHLYNILPIHDSIFYLADLAGLMYYNTSNRKLYFIDEKCGIPTNLKNYNEKYLIYNSLRGFWALEKKANKIIEVENIIPEFSSIKQRIVEKWLDVNDSLTILSGSDKKGLIVWNRKKHLIKEIGYDLKAGWQDNVVNSLTKLNDSIIIVCQDNNIGLYNIFKNTIFNLTLKDPENNSSITLFFDCLLTNKFIIILAYGHGVYFLDYNFKLKKVVNTKSNLSNNGVYSLIEDRQGFIWVSTNNGLNRINPNNFAVRSYFEDDGIHNNAFEENSSAKYGNHIFFGGVNGFTSIAPENITESVVNPKIYLTQVKLISNNIDTTITCIGQSIIRIPNYINQTVIYFASDNFIKPSRNRYFYKIDGIQDNWVDLGNENKISLIEVKPGKYNLQIKTKNSYGIESVNSQEIVIKVEPKWYQTWWFYLLIALTVAAILYALYRYRISQIKKQHEIRKNIATDLHDDLGSTLNSVKVFTNLAISGVKQEESLQQVKDNLTEATMSLRDMIWVLDDSLDTVDELITRLKQFAIPVAAASNIEATIKADSDVNARQLTKEEKRNLFLICKEAINNSIKYSGANQIDVSVTASGKKIQIVVSDNGKGFNVDEVKKGYGLKNMQYRAGQIKYKVTLTSSLGKGTQIAILPS